MPLWSGEALGSLCGSRRGSESSGRLTVDQVIDELDGGHARGGDCSRILLGNVPVSLATSPTERVSTEWGAKHLEGEANA